MNKSALKKFATEARKELLERVELQARKIGITEESIQKASVESSDAVYIDGVQLDDVARRQRNKLIKRIEEIGFNRVMEETAYTWFNRFIALRFMEVNDYLPTKVRVLSSYNAYSVEPDMMKEALSLDLNLDKEKIYELKLANDTDGLFKYLIKAHCNDLNRYMPFMFETIEDYKEILFPEGLLGTDSFVRQMTNTEVIPESDWESVEIVGWLYQYYIAEEKDRIIQAKKRYKAEELPYATQLFTPEWIVRYMVQNALGRYWVESHPEHNDLITNWEFYLENKEPYPNLEEELAPYINKELNIEDIKCFDPAMGSGHILVYMFDVLFEIYSKCGYVEREIPRLIIEKNLYGLDIDDRAYQLASFSIIMKALKHNKRFLRSIEREGLTMNLTSIQETNYFTEEEIIFLAGESTDESFRKMQCFIKQFIDAKAIGSLIKLKEYDQKFLTVREEIIEEIDVDLFQLEIKDRVLNLYKALLKQASIMSNEYDIFITNPPYAGAKYVTSAVTKYLNENYPTTKSDLYSAFMEYSFYRTKKYGQIGFITPFPWMFISSFEKIREKIVTEKNISSLIQLEYNAFEPAMVAVCAFTLRNYNANINGEYIRLSDFKGSENQPLKTLEAIKNSNVSYRFSFNSNNFSGIKGYPIAYWASKNVIDCFTFNDTFENSAVPKKGLDSNGQSDEFFRKWYEVDASKIYFDSSQDKSKYKWYEIDTGGSFRKWYGNRSEIINYENDGYALRNKSNKANIRNTSYYFKHSLTYGVITSKDISFRESFDNAIFYQHGANCFPNEADLYYILGLSNTKVVHYILECIAPTLSFTVGDIAKIPVKFVNERDKLFIENLVKECIRISKDEWDSYETSWDFLKHPFVKLSDNKDLKIEDLYSKWEETSNKWALDIRMNEQIINEFFISLYNLSEECSNETDINISLRKADRAKDIKSFISYAIGCILGRYSLDEDGIIYTGGEFISQRYKLFKVDDQNIVPISSRNYFDSSLLSRIIEFVQTVFGSENLEHNLEYIAIALGNRKDETSRETLQRYLLNDFYKDHVQMYQKRPIYWLFTSGKEKAFNCLIYMHRYDKTTLSRIRTDYLHEIQIRMDAEKKELLAIISGDYTPKEITAAKKELKSLDKKIDELKVYDEKLHHMADMQIEIDLDDGVEYNYELFKGLVAKK